MAFARSCLTWGSLYRFFMFFDPPITAPGLSSDDQSQTQVGDGRGAPPLGLVQVS
jgi:hypothetical protein